MLLAFVTIATAWAGYSAATWSTESRLDLARASTLRVEANRALGKAQELRNFDASTFNTWFAAYVLGDEAQMALAERRFRPQFKAAFDAWQATDPENDPSAPPGPTFMPQYRQPGEARAARLDRQADALAASGDEAAETADNYVRVSMVLAAVLFVVGIGTTFELRRIRWALAALGGVLLLGAVVIFTQQPVP